MINSRKLKILIYGMGGMGSLFRRFFSLRTYTVKGFDIDKSKSEVEEEEIGNFDVIFLCVPMEEIEGAMKKISEIAERKGKDPLLVDISSVKEDVLENLRKSGFDFLSIHPMMGPDSEIGLSNIIIVEESGREEERVILREFEDAGAILSRIHPEKHDKKMAEIQGIAHFLLLGMANFLKEKFEENYIKYSSPIFFSLYKLASRIINQDWRMYLKIQENSEYMREKFIESLKELDLKLKNEDSFEEVFEELRRVFTDAEGSTLIMDGARAARVPDGNINSLRGYIRLIDSLILRLIEKRVEAGKRIAIYKKKDGMPIEISEVEDVKLKELSSRSNLNRIILKRVFQDIMDLTKDEEYKLLGISKRLAVLGPIGSFSDDVGVKLAGSRVPLIYCSTVEEIMRLVEEDDNVYGLIPIENSVHGTVLRSIDALMRHGVEVFAETKMEIIHVLAAKRKLDLSEIEKIYSHPQAIAQCSGFINNYLPHAQLRYTSSTSDAISMLDDSSAAIVSENAAEIYNLFVLKKGIQDMENNVTRFYLVRKKGGKVEGRITCLFFGVEDKPGSLKDVLEVFSKRKINLRKLESRPSGMALGDYIFFSEVEKKLDEEDLKELRGVTTFYRVAGVFDEVNRLNL